MTNYRPVTLQEHAVFGKKVFAKASTRPGIEPSPLNATIPGPSTLISPGISPGIFPSRSSAAAGSTAGSSAATGSEAARSASLTAVPLPDRPAAAAAVLGSPLVEERALADVEGDKDGLLALVAEVAALGQSTLVFCGTKRHAESCADQLAQVDARTDPDLPPA